MEKVADVLGRKYPQFNTISPVHLVSDALHQMCAENVEYLIVLESDRFAGIFTDHEVANKVMSVNKPLNEATVSEFMNRNIPVATLNDSLEYCMQLMERHNSRYLAIYDKFDFKGVVTLHDLMKEALSKRNTVFNHNEGKDTYSWSY